MVARRRQVCYATLVGLYCGFVVLGLGFALSVGSLVLFVAFCTEIVVSC